MRKRILSFVLAACMTAAMLPVSAQAANTQQVTVAGAVLTDGMGWNNDGTTTQSGSDRNNAYFTNGSLHLNNAKIHTKGTAITATGGELTILLQGDSMIDADAENNNGMIQAINVSTDKLAITGQGMLDIKTAYDGLVNSKGAIEIQNASVSIQGKNTGASVSGALTLSGSAMLVAETKNKGVTVGGLLTVSEYAALYAETEERSNGSALSCGALWNKGYVGAFGDQGAITCNGNLTMQHGTLEAIVRRNYTVPAINVTKGAVNTSGLYVQAGISGLDAKQVTDFDTNYTKYRNVAICEDSSWLDWQNAFEDVTRADWFYDYVCYVNQHSLMNGMPSMRFEPMGKVTRAQTVQILYSLSEKYGEQYGLDANGQSAVFADVHPNVDWFAKPVGWAGAVGIVSGVGENRFDPMASITREQFAVVLFNYAKKLGYDTNASAELNFSDTAEISDWAQTALEWAVGAGLMSGYPDGKMRPKGTLTRAEAAVMIRGFITTTLASERAA